MDCQFVRSVWFSSVLIYRIASTIDLNDWLLSVLSCGDVFSVQILCYAIYKVWLSRNLKIYQDENSCPLRIVGEIVDLVGEFNRWNNLQVGSQLANGTSEIYRHEVHIIQVDASISPDGFMTMRFIIHDHQNYVAMDACKREDIFVGQQLGKLWQLDEA